MANLVIGNMQIDRIVEMILPFETISDFFPDARQEQIEACRKMFEPWALCPPYNRHPYLLIQYPHKTNLLRVKPLTIRSDVSQNMDVF